MVRLRDMGEKLAVREIAGTISPSAALGPGDDAAAVRLGDRFLVASTDMLWEGTHFHPRMSWWQKGWMAAAVNLSDMAAMGAQPIGLLLAMGLSPELEMDQVRDMVQGAADCCDVHGTEYLGGDTKECPQLVLTGTSLGLAPLDGLLRRKGARPGDLLMMTGTAGLAAAGLLALEKGIESPAAVKALFEPRPRVKEGTLLSSSGAVTSGMDTSDGLSMSLHELGQAGGVGFRVEAVPLDPEVERIASLAGTDAMDIALHGGGDYQLLFTVRPEGLGTVLALLGADAAVIGTCVPGAGNTLKRDGGDEILEPKGYEHFRR